MTLNLILMAALIIVVCSNAYWIVMYNRIKRKVDWVEVHPHVIENMIELSDSLNKFGKAIVEIRCLDQSSIFYREPVR